MCNSFCEANCRRDVSSLLALVTLAAIGEDAAHPRGRCKIESSSPHLKRSLVTVTRTEAAYRREREADVETVQELFKMSLSPADLRSNANNATRRRPSETRQSRRHSPAVTSSRSRVIPCVCMEIWPKGSQRKWANFELKLSQTRHTAE